MKRALSVLLVLVCGVALAAAGNKDKKKKVKAPVPALVEEFLQNFPPVLSAHPSDDLPELLQRMAAVRIQYRRDNFLLRIPIIVRQHHRFAGFGRRRFRRRLRRALVRQVAGAVGRRQKRVAFRIPFFDVDAVQDADEIGRPAAHDTGFDPGDEPLDDARPGVRESSEEQAIRAVTEHFAVERIGEVNPRT